MLEFLPNNPSVLGRMELDFRSPKNGPSWGSNRPSMKEENNTDLDRLQNMPGWGRGLKAGIQQSLDETLVIIWRHL